MSREGVQVPSPPGASSCFACNRPTLGVPAAFHSRLACNDCTKKARLLPTGTALGAIIGSSSTWKQHGKLLNAVLNPIAIGAYRAWVGYSGDGVLVLEEQERSSDWFEFVVQHLDPGPRVLRWLLDQESLPVDARELMQAIARVVAPQSLAPVMNAWALTRAGKGALAKAGPIHTAADLDAVMGAMQEEARELAESDDLHLLVQRLCKVADVEWPR